MTVFKNIAFGLRTYKLPKSQVKEQVSEIIKMLNLDGLENRLPRELSGGQRQRVALARAAVKRAEYFLLDEPLSNLDAQLRTQARKELVKLHELYNPTFIYVTHDQIEAMTIGQNIVLMNKGEVQMQDIPYNIYHRPVNVFTARFIGSPPMNIAKMEVDNGALRAGALCIPLSAQWKAQIGDAKEILFGIRPENIQLEMERSENAVEVEIKYLENYGNKLGAYFNVGESEFIAMQEQYSEIGIGKKAYWKPEYARMSFFSCETERNIGYPKDYLTAADISWNPSGIFATKRDTA